MTPIELYYFGSPNSRKVTIMLEELGVPYTIIPIQMSRGDPRRPDYAMLAPSQKMPVIVDPDGPGGRPISVFESGAILKYLAEKHGRFYGKDWYERVKIDEWLFWQVGGFGPMLGQNNHFSVYAPEKIPYAIKRYSDETHRLFRVLNKQLEGRDYIAGDYSIADIASIGWAQAWERYGISREEFPAFGAWLDRMNARPAVARGLVVGKDTHVNNLATDKEAQKVLFNQR